MKKLQSLNNPIFEAFPHEAMNLVLGDGDTGATTGTNPYDSGESTHGKATADCIVYGSAGEICRQEFWHADGTVTTWSQC